MKKIISMMLIFLISGSALFAQEKIIEASSKSVPNWIKKLPSETNEYAFSVGMRTGVKVMQEGERQARLNALGKLLETYFGVKAKSVYQKVRKNLETEYLDSMRVETKGELWGIKLSDWYWRKYEVKSSSGIEYRYDVWVLLQGKKADIARAVEQITERSRKIKKTSKAKIMQAKMDLVNYDVKKALQEIQDAKELTETLDDEFFVKEISKKSEVLLTEILQHLKIKRLTDKILKHQVPLKVKVTYKGVPQEGIPVEFSFSRNSGHLRSPILTDKEGIAIGLIRKIDFILRPSTIEAKIGYKGGNSVQFFLESLPIKVSVLAAIYEETGGERVNARILQANLFQKFTEAGFSVKEVGLSRSEIQTILQADFSTIKEFVKNYNTDYIILGEVNTKAIPKTGEILFANAYGVLKVIDGKTGKIIISEIIDENGGGLNKDQAAKNALKNGADKSVPALREKIEGNLIWREERR